MYNPCILIWQKHSRSRAVPADIRGNQTLLCGDRSVLSVWYTSCPSLPPLAGGEVEHKRGVQLPKPCAEAAQNPPGSLQGAPEQGAQPSPSRPSRRWLRDRQVCKCDKTTDSPGGDSQPTSAHPSLGKQRILDVEEGLGLDGWMLAPAQERICDKLYSPALSWKEYARAGCVCAGSLCWALRGSGSRRWWEEMLGLETVFTGLSNCDHGVSTVHCQHHVCQTLAHLWRIWMSSRKSCLPVWPFAQNWETVRVTQQREFRASRSP